MDHARDNDPQGDADYLRGASHALAALANPKLKMADAVEAVQFLRGRIAAGKQVPPLMWFFAKVSDGYQPRDAYDLWLLYEGRREVADAQ
jgi:hypothetical protein